MRYARANSCRDCREPVSERLRGPQFPLITFSSLAPAGMLMKISEVRRLSDDALRAGLRELVAQDRTHTVRLLIHLAEFDSRRLYRAEGFSCMKHYCMGELKMSEDIANKRMWVARRARRFPRILVGLNEGSLTLTAVAMLTRYLTAQNANDLLAAAANKTNAQVAEVIAQRFPRQDLPTLVEPLISRQPLFAAPFPGFGLQHLTADPSPGSDCQEVAARQLDRPVEASVVHPRVTPLAPQRYGVQFTISQSDRALLRHVQDLLSHGKGSLDEGDRKSVV
jgi:hypothetical protein